jgi:hypothetical protein
VEREFFKQFILFYVPLLFGGFFSERLFDRHGVFGLFSELAGWQLCILPLFKRTYPLFINYYRR